MTVEELIKELEKIEDKSAKIVVYDQCGGFITFDEVAYLYSEDDTDDTIVCFE